MRLFSKFTFLCNACFILAIILRWIEISKHSMGNYSGAIPFQPLESTLVILGYGAIFVNFLFLCSMVYRIAIKKNKLIPAWLVYFNLLIFPVQVYFFFFL
jgi:hypothetical protein